MSAAVGGSEKRPGIILYIGAFLLAAAIGGGSYVLLVVREDIYTQKQKEQLTHLEEEMRKADEYLRRHGNPKAQKEIVANVAADVAKRIPYGPIDLKVGSYIDTAAQQANISGLKWTVLGGIKVPKNPGEDKRTPLQRLSLEIPKLKSSSIEVSFSGRYKDVLAFLRLLSQSNWAIEVYSVDMKRAPKSLDIDVVLKTRYLYE